MPLFLLSIFGGIGKFFTALFTFFTTKPGCYLGIALLVAGAFWWQGAHGYKMGLAQGQADEATHIAAAETAAYKHGLERQQVLDAGLARAADLAGFLRGKAQAVTVYLTKKVPQYVTIETDRRYPLPCGLIKLHDAAALGTRPENLSDGICGADEGAAPVAASALAQIAIDNYGLYHEAEAQIAGLQDAVRAMAKALGAELQITQLPADMSSLQPQQPGLDHAEGEKREGTAEAQPISKTGDRVAQDHHAGVNGPGGP